MQIVAAGSTGDEEMQLLIKDEVVAIYRLSGTDAEETRFATFTLDRDGVDVADIRVAFTNDLYQPENGYDRNLRVDQLIVDGVSYETEAPSVYSTGTWVNDSAITPGRWSTEYLHADGYFQFKASGSVIKIVASGQTGDEAVALRIDGQQVAQWNGISQQSQEYRFVADYPVSASQIQVAFLNDAYDAEAITIETCELTSSK